MWNDQIKEGVSNEKEAFSSSYGDEYEDGLLQGCCCL
jgi:hypothetical protein